MKRSEPHPSLDGTLRRLLWSMLLLVCVILVATLAILLLHNQQYSLVTANIVRASQFNQNFKEEVDLKMYYYVIDSSYGETLPLQEVGEAKALAQELLSGTQDRQSRKAITSAIDLCENLHERIVQITETIRDTEQDFSVLAGNWAFLLPSLYLGAKGGTLALSNVLPNECAELIELFEAGKAEEARQLALRLMPVNAAVTTKYGIAGLRASMEYVGLFGGEPRLPLRRASEDVRAYVRSTLVNAGIAVRDID